MSNPEATRHLTVTGFLVADDCLALHWHLKVEAWLPPGGHVEPNEDPIQAVLREINEETGLNSTVIPRGAHLPFDYPSQIDPPLTILVEDVVDQQHGAHQHIDLVYVCRPLDGRGELPEGWLWVTSAEMASGVSLSTDKEGAVPPPADVRHLARVAFEIASA
jgi:8-oxo-dGTP diphosphatase